MSILKLSLTDEENERLAEMANMEKLSSQDFIRYKLFGVKNPEKFTQDGRRATYRIVRKGDE